MSIIILSASFQYIHFILIDRYVILGNHRDAWVYGAIDPSSATASLLEVTRAYGSLVKSGKIC